MPEVLVLTIEPSLRTDSSFAKRSRLIWRFSTTASQIQSQSLIRLRSSSEAAVIFAACSAVIVGFLPPHSFSMPCSDVSVLISKRTTSQPLAAQSPAIPAPMVPAPMTATFLIVFGILYPGLLWRCLNSPRQASRAGESDVSRGSLVDVVTTHQCIARD